MAGYKCINCEELNETSFTDDELEQNVNVRRICSRCGSVNMVQPSKAEGMLICIPPQGFEWKLPSGKIGNPITGFIYPTSTGKHKLEDGTPLTRDVWLRIYNIDPEIAYQYMRSQMLVRPKTFKIG
jgi:DNA-directed RNA polymerase subunit RPC12/RpoP